MADPVSRTKQPMKDLRSTVETIAQAKPEQLSYGYVQRLRRLLRIRRDHYDELNEQGLRLLDRSIFAAYCDCLDIGQGYEAKEVLKDVRLTLALPKSTRRNASSSNNLTPLQTNLTSQEKKLAPEGYEY